ERVGARASLQLFGQADHSFRVPARAGRTEADIRRDMMDTLAAWICSVASRPDWVSAAAKRRVGRVWNRSGLPPARAPLQLRLRGPGARRPLRENRAARVPPAPPHPPRG